MTEKLKALPVKTFKKNNVGAPFHERHRYLLILGLVGGLYHPALDKVFPSRAIQWVIYLYTTISCLFLCSFPLLNIIHLFFIANKLYQVTMDLMIICSGMHAWFRMTSFLFHRKKFGELYEMWDDFFSNDGDVVERQANIDKHYKAVRRIMYKLSAMGCTALNPWMLAQYFNQDKIMKVPTPIPYRQQSPDFELLITFYAFPCIIHTFAAAAIHILMLLPIIWILSELQRLKFALRSIMTLGENLPTPSTQKVAEVNKRLSLWIKQHQKLIIFYRKTQSLVWESFSIEMLATFMAAWLTAFNYVQDIVVEDKLTQIFFYLPYVLMFAVTCSYSDKVEKESISLMDEAYTKEWMVLPKKIRSSLVVIAQQTQIPYIIKGFGIFPTGFITFGQIMQSAYTVLNFLLAAQKEGD